MKEDVLTVAGLGPGTRHNLTVLRFGEQGARPKVYVQGGLHADEAPGMMAARALAAMLERLEGEGCLKGEVVVVPCANPIGLAQRMLGSHLGRFDLADGQNFNRGFADLAPAAGDLLSGRLGEDEAENVRLIRDALDKVHAALCPVTPAETLKHLLLGLALDADLVLDLHCDGEAEMHLYTLTAQAQTLAPLSALLGAKAILVADESGLNPFDEATSRPWADLAARFHGAPIPLACTAATVELRGEGDISHELARADASAIVDYLIHTGVIKGAAPAIPPLQCEPTPLSGSEPLTAPRSGIVIARARPGERMSAGDIVAEILDPITGETASVRATTAGVLYALSGARIAARGKRLGKIAGVETRRTGALLSP